MSQTASVSRIQGEKSMGMRGTWCGCFNGMCGRSYNLISVDTQHPLNAGKNMLIKLAWNIIYVNILVISSAVLNTGNGQYNWK